ncbi:sulfite exporter TauE/SafE family protein [soil metagenome]|jgi:uncharacterized membrane protein YfcA
MHAHPMSPATLALLSATVFLAAFVQGSTGIGFALIVVPVLGLLAPEQLPVCVLVLMLPLNCYVAWRERAGLDLRSGGWITTGRIAGTFAGLWVLAALSASGMNLLIGTATLTAVVATMLMPAFTPTRGVYVAVGLITGVTETATGIGGPPLALVYQHHPPAVMRSTIALCFLIGELLSLALLWYTGHAQASQMAGALQLLPALVTGALLSRLTQRRVNSRILRLFVMVFSIASGAVLLLRA